jgi:uncharacterized membrane protein
LDRAGEIHVKRSDRKDDQRVCAICGRRFPRGQVVSGGVVRPSVAEAIRQDLPQWSADDAICREDLDRYRDIYVRRLLESERGELSSLEQEVVDSLREHEVLSLDTELEFEQRWSFGERLADRIAAFGGSWGFLICFGVLTALWITVNSLVLFWRPVDPYPYILLNLVLSCLAAVQAPIIMMSQNRQEAKDRLRAQHDYQVNLKAELEIRHLHEKVDHLLSHQWERLVEIQEIQLDLLSEIGRRR